MMKTILIVDDEPGTRRSLKIILEDDYQVLTANDARQALKILKINPVNLIFLDIFMGEMNGMELLKILRNKYPHIKVVMVTAAKSLKTASEALDSGVADYIVKPFAVEEIRLVAKRVLKLHKLTGELELLRAESRSAYNGNGIVGESPVLKRILKQITRIAPTKTPVLISGETGTGKELIARTIHSQSQREKRPFIAVHCASLPESLLESELFGYEPGAFTGAEKQKPGFFELADGGTLFLDEIGEMSLATQVKILRVLQESEFSRVGGTKTIKVDVRLISATNKDLKKQIRKKTFREDLYYRLNVVSLDIPPLRERKEDIAILTEYYFNKYKTEMNLPVKRISPQALKIMEEYSWLGNIREMKNVLERVLVLHGKEKVIMPFHLPPDLSDIAPHSFYRNTDDIFKNSSLEESVAEFERKLIEKALQKAGGVQTQAAEILKVSRRVLRYRMEKLNI